MSKVSIIVPVYNGAKSLRRCVDSILAQDHKDIEVILVDDGSKDESFAIISEYAKKDERVVAIHKDNSGVSSTRNVALSLAKGKYIQFIDVDDYLPFDSTKLMHRAMEENECDMVISDFYRVIEDKVSKKGSIKKGGLILRSEYADKMLLSPADFYYGVLWNKMYRKQIIDDYQLAMDENISYSEDAIFNLQYLLHCDRIFVLKSPVYYYVKTEGSLVSKNMNVSSTVKMKTSVIRYYDAFYKQILDKDDYEARKPIIYGYLLAVSRDALALPVIDDTKKLGEENGGLFDLQSNVASELQFDRLSSAVFDQILNAVGTQNDLEFNDIRILYYLYKRNKAATVDQIAAACELNNAMCMLSLTKLLTGPYLKIADIRIFSEDKVFYEYVSSALDLRFDQAEEDFRSLLYDGLSIEDLSAYARIRKHIFGNLKKTIIK